MKKSLGFTTLFLFIVTILFTIAKFGFNLDNYNISPNISLSISLGFWYFLIFTIVLFIVFLTTKDKKKRGK